MRVGDGKRGFINLLWFYLCIVIAFEWAGGLKQVRVTISDVGRSAVAFIDTEVPLHAFDLS